VPGTASVGFKLEADDAIRVHFAADVNDDPSAWVFWRRRLPPQRLVLSSSSAPRILHARATQIPHSTLTFSDAA
jgi:hypothetical protein